MLAGLEEEVGRARKMNITVDDDEAYLRCCQLLQEEFQAEEDKFAKLRRKLKISIQTVEEHVDICQGEKAERQKELTIIEEEIKELQVEAGKVNKRHKRIEQLRGEIEQEGAAIESNNLKLQDLKERSY
jgi:chromosome segregation ATPase